MPESMRCDFGARAACGWLADAVAVFYALCKGFRIHIHGGRQRACVRASVSAAPALAVVQVIAVINGLQLK